MCRSTISGDSCWMVCWHKWSPVFGRWCWVKDEITEKEKSLLTHISKCIRQGERKTEPRRRMIRSTSRNRSRRYRILIFMRLLQSPTSQPWTPAQRFNSQIFVSDGYCGHSTEFTSFTIGRECWLTLTTRDRVWLFVRDSRDDQFAEPSHSN